jgi:hypothetical protein
VVGVHRVELWTSAVCRRWVQWERNQSRDLQSWLRVSFGQGVRPSEETIVRSRGIRIGAVVFGMAILGAACATPPPPPPPPPTPVVRQDPASLGVDNTLGNAGVVHNSASVSLDGRFVAFSTLASNMSSPPSESPPACCVLYVRDRQEGTVQYIARSKEGRISGNGRYISYRPYAAESYIHVFDRVTGTDRSFYLYYGVYLSFINTEQYFVSDNGESVVYGQEYSALLERNGLCRVHDLELNTDIPCLGTDYGGEGWSLRGVSRDTRFVIYSPPPPLLHTYRLWDRTSNTLTDIPSLSSPLNPWGVWFGKGLGQTVSDDGRYLLGLEPGTSTPVVVDMQAVGGPAATQMPGVTPSPTSFTRSVDMAPDGRYVVAQSEQVLDALDTDVNNDLYLWDTTTGTVRLASKHIESGMNLSSWAFQCIAGPGSVTRAGDTCVNSTDPMVAFDSNGFLDQYIVPRP